MSTPTIRRWMPATSLAEARLLVSEGHGHETRLEAQRHLGDIQKPPTDPHYAAMYRVFGVDVPDDIPKNPQPADWRADHHEIRRDLVDQHGACKACRHKAHLNGACTTVLANGVVCRCDPPKPFPV